MTTESSSADSQISVGAAASSQSLVHTIFIGPNGLRAGWRLLIFITMGLAFRRSAQFVVGHIPALRDWLGAQNNAAIDAGPQIFAESILALAVFLPALVMSKIEA